MMTIMAMPAAPSARNPRPLRAPALAPSTLLILLIRPIQRARAHHPRRRAHRLLPPSPMAPSLCPAPGRVRTSPAGVLPPTECSPARPRPRRCLRGRRPSPMAPRPVLAVVPSPVPVLVPVTAPMSSVPVPIPLVLARVRDRLAGTLLSPVLRPLLLSPIWWSPGPWLVWLLWLRICEKTISHLMGCFLC